MFKLCNYKICTDSSLSSFLIANCYRQIDIVTSLLDKKNDDLDNCLKLFFLYKNFL